MPRHDLAEPTEPPASKPAEAKQFLAFPGNAEAIGQTVEGEVALRNGNPLANFLAVPLLAARLDLGVGVDRSSVSRCLPAAGTHDGRSRYNAKAQTESPAFPAASSWASSLEPSSGRFFLAQSSFSWRAVDASRALPGAWLIRA